MKSSSFCFKIRWLGNFQKTFHRPSVGAVEKEEDPNSDDVVEDLKVLGY